MSKILAFILLFFHAPRLIALTYDNFAQKNAELVPKTTPQPLELCTDIPVLMYHHVQDWEKAKREGEEKLTVSTYWLKQHLKYLKDNGYSIIEMQDLSNFFDHGTKLPNKPVLLTFDDAYDDFASDAVPQLGTASATLFVPPNLVNKNGYVTWAEIAKFPKNILLANHTWSHYPLDGNNHSVIENQIVKGETNLNNPNVFAYPYGAYSDFAASVLEKRGYSLAFTTKHGSHLCKSGRLFLPRIRAGNYPIRSVLPQ